VPKSSGDDGRSAALRQVIAPVWRRLWWETKGRRERKRRAIYSRVQLGEEVRVSGAMAGSDGRGEHRVLPGLWPEVGEGPNMRALHVSDSERGKRIPFWAG
jgi:hypothetical protein